MNFWIRFGAADLQLGEGTFVIGRDATCDVVLQDRVASRRHARLVCRTMGCSIEDLHSSNGTFVNGEKIEGPRLLAPGDIIVIGRTELELTQALDRPSRRRVSTKDELPPAMHAGGTPADAIATGQRDVLELLAGVAQRSIDHGNTEQAEKVLGPVLTQILDTVRRNQPVDPNTVEAASRHGLVLGEGTNKAEWLYYVLELHWHLGKPIPPSQLRRFTALWRERSDRREDLLQAYVERLRGSPGAGSQATADAVRQLAALLAPRGAPG